jgi:hypothetical protein
MSGGRSRKEEVLGDDGRSVRMHYCNNAKIQIETACHIYQEQNKPCGGNCLRLNRKRKDREKEQ